MTSLPPLIARRLQELTYDSRGLAYLHIDGELRVAEAGGHLERHGLGQLRIGDPVLEHAYFLEGLLPIAEPFYLPAVELAGGRAADIHIYVEDEEAWIMLLDVTGERDNTRRVQQKAYEMTLLKEKEAILNRRLEATNAELRETQRKLEITRDALREDLRRKQLELTEARTLQLSLVPEPFKGIASGRSLSVDVILEPAKEVGGDLVDYFWIPGGLLVLILGDVSGKGAAAALMMARTHALFRGLANRPDAEQLFANPDEAVRIVNANLAAANGSCTFVTLLLATFDVSAGRLAYVRAGHLAPFLRRADGCVERLPGFGGPPLGLLEDAVHKSARYEMQPGDGFLIITDGISEASDSSSNLFGEEPVTALLSRNGERGCEVLDLLMKQVKEFEGASPPADDKAVILLELFS
ncbi:MAG: serine/threonine-protein phosphatase [Hyphomicrobium sp.]|jgi:serine phosphatase RsbU (regulator of sigma subunit)|nr:serine/threonine-protein phosphatase [Hyphomicrobium sp.]